MNHLSNTFVLKWTITTFLTVTSNLGLSTLLKGIMITEDLRNSLVKKKLQGFELIRFVLLAQLQEDMKQPH